MRVSLACKVQLNMTELVRIVMYSGILCSSAMLHDMLPKRLWRRLTLWGPNWQGILTSMIKYLSLKKIEEKSYLSTSYESLKNVPN